MEGEEGAELGGEFVVEDGVQRRVVAPEAGPARLGQLDVGAEFGVGLRGQLRILRADERVELGEGGPVVEVGDLLADGEADGIGEILRAGLEEGALGLAIVAVTERLRRDQGRCTGAAPRRG